MFLAEKQYDCIYIPAYSFSLLIQDSDVFSGLATMKDMLKPEGRILMGVLTDFGYTNNKKHSIHIDNPRIVSEDNIEIVLNSRTVYDKENSISLSKMTYELFENGKSTKKETEDFYIKRYRNSEIEEFVEAACLTIEDIFVDFSKTKYTRQNTETMIYVLKNN